RRARARQPREAQLHSAHGAIRRGRTAVSKTVALRTALIWRDEVMSDVVLEKPQTITVGHAGKPTFIVPDIGLPKQFAIVRPGNRGYLLTLGDRMRGTICIDGREK